MIEPSELEGAIAVQVNAIVGEAMSEAFKWLCRREYGIDYVPPLFKGPVEAMRPTGAHLGLRRPGARIGVRRLTFGAVRSRSIPTSSSFRDAAVIVVVGVAVGPFCRWLWLRPPLLALVASRLSTRRIYAPSGCQRHPHG